MVLKTRFEMECYSPFMEIIFHQILKIEKRPQNIANKKEYFESQSP